MYVFYKKKITCLKLPRVDLNGIIAGYTRIVKLQKQNCDKVYIMFSSSANVQRSPKRIMHGYDEVKNSAYNSTDRADVQTTRAKNGT